MEAHELVSNMLKSVLINPHFLLNQSLPLIQRSKLKEQFNILEMITFFPRLRRK